MNYKILFVVLLLLVVPSLVLAVEGCFLNTQSDLYCTSVSQIQAQQECLFLEGCNLENSFEEGVVCEQESGCQEVLCKSSCTKELAGKCVGGEVPAGEEVLWCQSGCCRFETSSGNSCSVTTSKWLCEVRAQNRGVDIFNFDSNLDKGACESSCNERDFLSGVTLDKVSPPPKVEKELIDSSLSNSENQDGGFSLFFWVILFGVILFVLSRIPFVRRFFQSLFLQLKELPSFDSSDLGNFFSPFFSSSGQRAKINRLKEKHRRKVKSYHENLMLSRAGFTTVTPSKVSRNLLKLMHLVKRNHNKNITDPQKTIFNNLDDLAKIEYKKNTFNSSKKVVKENPQKIINKLRKISQK